MKQEYTHNVSEGLHVRMCKRTPPDAN